MASLGDFYINFTAKTEDIDNALKETQKKFSIFSGSFGKNVLSTALGILSAESIAKLQTGREKVTAMADEMVKLSRQLNVSIDDLFAFGEAAARSGSSAKNLQNSLVNISKRLTTAQIGDRGAAPIKKVFEELGVEMFEVNGEFRNLIDILRDLNVAVQQFGSEKSLGYLARLGIDDKTARLLQLVPEEFNKLIERQKTLGTYSLESAEKVEKFNDLLSDFNQIMSVLTVELGSKLLPVLNKILDFVVKFLAVFNDKTISSQVPEKITSEIKTKSKVQQEKTRIEDLKSYEQQLGVEYPEPQAIIEQRQKAWKDMQEKAIGTVQLFFERLQDGIESFFRGVPKQEKKATYTGSSNIRPGSNINNTLAVSAINIYAPSGDPEMIAKEIEENLEGAWKRLSSRSLSGLKS